MYNLKLINKQIIYNIQLITIYITNMTQPITYPYETKEMYYDESLNMYIGMISKRYHSDKEYTYSYIPFTALYPTTMRERNLTQDQIDINLTKSYMNNKILMNE
jgi:hypothetical protein